MNQSPGPTIVLASDAKADGSPALMAAETLKLTTQNPAVFATDVLEAQSKGKKDYEHASKGMLAAYGQIVLTRAAQKNSYAQF